MIKSGNVYKVVQRDRKLMRKVVGQLATVIYRGDTHARVSIKLGDAWGYYTVQINELEEDNQTPIKLKKFSVWK